MMNNKKGVKILAAIAVFAMVAAALVVAFPASDAKVIPGEDKYVYDRDGPLNFAEVGNDLEYEVNGESKAFDNYALGNQIEVAYDASSMTYVVTGILAKQDISDGADNVFKALWEKNTEAAYGLAFCFNNVEKKEVTIKVGNGKANTVSADEGCLLYIKETTISTVMIDEKEYSIDFTGVTLVDDAKNNPSAGYVIIPNANALIGNDSGIDGNGGKWSIDANGVLTLTNYNGKEYFDACDIAGNVSTIVLVGDNTITLSGATIAICTENNLTIKSIDGVGSLAINMTVSKDATAIDAGAVSINGVTVSIDIVEDVEADAKAIETIGIDATSYDIYDATVKITVGEENYTKAIGLNAENGAESADVSIRSAKVTIDAGNRAINAKGSVYIMASEVVVTGSELGIRTYGIVEADVTITNSSKVTANALGLAEGFYTPYGISANDALVVQSDSVITTDGLIIYGLGMTDSTNNATIINDGDMMIWDDAVFENKAVLENNGTIGVFGTLKNSAGQITNNGTIQNFDSMRKGSPTAGATETLTIDGKTVKVTLTRISPQVDGSYLVAFNTTVDNVEPSKVFLGSMSIVYDGSKITSYELEGTNDNGIVTVSYDGEKFNVYMSEDSVAGDVDGKTSAYSTLFSICESDITVTGGKLINAGTLVVNADCLKLVNGGELTNNGKMAFNADVEIAKGKINGNDVPLAEGVTVTLSGTVDMVFTNAGSYKTSQPGTTSVTVEYSNAIKVTGTPNKTVITTPSKDTDKGVVSIEVPNTDNKKAAQVVVTQGTAKVSSDIGLNMALFVSTGAILNVDGKVGVTNGVIGVQDGATINMKIAGNKDTFKFGELAYVISFANEGYTYYGSLQYALANAAEGATLNLNSDADIDVDTAVKAGITLVFAENVTLSIAKNAEEKITVSMGENAKFVLAKGASIAIAADKATVSGDIVYDANEIVLDKIVFTDAVSITALVNKTESSLDIGSAADAKTNSGKITIAAGNATGKLYLDNVVENSKLKSTANIIISESAVSKIVLADNTYTETVIDGVMTSAGDITFKGAVSGDGKILLADAKKVTFNETVADIIVTNGTDSIVLDKASGKIYDDSGKVTGGVNLVILSVAKTATKDAYLDIQENIVSGDITINGNAAIGYGNVVFNLGADAIMTVPKDSTLTVYKSVVTDVQNNPVYNKVTGLLKVAGTINMLVADDSTTSSYGKLDYQITYTDGDYTVYTMLNTGVNNASAGDSFTVNTDMDITENMNIPAGVSIVVAEDAAITVKPGKYITIGTPITTLGASNSSISGKVILDGNAFFIAYNDGSVDLSKASIVVVTGPNTEAAAMNSQYNMLNEIYATVYIGETNEAGLTAQQSLVEKVLVPNIDGYRFLGWEPLVDGKKIGQTDFDANMKANMVQITFQKVDGISYYVDNEKMNIIGAPVYVAYGATITAVADSGYTGTPLVNGKAYITVDNSLKTVVGSGVSPAVDPTPVEPEKDDGMALTDILLIVLVILAAILVIVVAIRMMRS